MVKKVINVKINEELWRKARSVADLEGKPVNQWLAEAIELKLKLKLKEK